MKFVLIGFMFSSSQEHLMVQVVLHYPSLICTSYLKDNDADKTGTSSDRRWCSSGQAGMNLPTSAVSKAVQRQNRRRTAARRLAARLVNHILAVTELQMQGGRRQDSEESLKTPPSAGATAPADAE